MPKRRTKYRLVLSPSAAREIRSIQGWQEENSTPVKARSYMTTLATALKIIQKDPLSVPTKSASDYREGLRQMHMKMAKKGAKGQHILFFTVTPPELVEVERILHESSNIIRHLEANLKQAVQAELAQFEAGQYTCYKTGKDFMDASKARVMAKHQSETDAPKLSPKRSRIS